MTDSERQTIIRRMETELDEQDQDDLCKIIAGVLKLRERQRKTTADNAPDGG